MPVDRLESRQHHPGDVFHLLHEQLIMALQMLHEIWPFTAAHHNVEGITALEEVLVGHDVRVVKCPHAPKQLQLLSFGKLRCSRRMPSLHPHDLHAQRQAVAVALRTSVDLAKGAMAQQLPFGEESLEDTAFQLIRFISSPQTSYTVQTGGVQARRLGSHTGHSMAGARPSLAVKPRSHPV